MLKVKKPLKLPFRIPALKTIGHRGGGILAPENSLRGFSLAKLCGLTWVEFDTQPCATGEWVLMHDDSLERCSNGQGFIRDSSWDLLKELKIGKEFDPISFSEPIPLLSETLETLATLGLHPNIEIKTLLNMSNTAKSNHLENFLKILKLHWPPEASPPLISSFDADILFEIKERAPELPLGFNIDGLEANTLEKMNNGDFFSLHADYEQLSNEALEMLVQEPFPLLLYTVNDPMLAKHYFDKGVWAIFSDKPNLMASSL